MPDGRGPEPNSIQLRLFEIFMLYLKTFYFPISGNGGGVGRMLMPSNGYGYKGNGKLCEEVAVAYLVCALG